MKTTITQSTTVDNILGFLWAIFVVTGASYLVFYKGISAWWFVLAVLLLSASVWHKKTVIEQ